jgi:hypothetical protein
VTADHRHLRTIDCLTVRTTCLVCFISTVNGHSKKKKEKKPIMSGTSSGHITKLKQSIILRCLCGRCGRETMDFCHRYLREVDCSRHISSQKSLKQSKSTIRRPKQGRRADKTGRLGRLINPLYLPICLQWSLTELTFTTRQVVSRITLPI